MVARVVGGKVVSPKNEILTYAHCARCMGELPKGMSPKEYSMVQIGFTTRGIQIWCNRHDMQVAHIPIKGLPVPKCTCCAKEEKRGKRRRAV